MTRAATALIVTMMLAPIACVAQSQPTVVASPHGTPQAAVVTTVDGQAVSLQAGLENAYVLQGSPGEAYLVVQLAAAAMQTQTTRPAMAVALVIDRSGSMSGEKIVNARAAATSFIQNMADGDVVALYQYDDTVEQVAPPTVINANSRAALTGLVQQLRPRGSTNLHGGLVAGIEALGSAAAERPVRRVLLISDGLANVGPSSPAQLGNVAAAGAARGISVTTIGVGVDYDESVMTAVAIRSGGRFYHLQEPAQMASILTTELNALGATVARGVLLELVPTSDVQILGASGADLSREGDTVRLAVGDMLGDQTRQVVIPVRLPTEGEGEQALGTLRLRYDLVSSEESQVQETSVDFNLTDSPEQVAQSVQPRFAAAVETYRNAHAQRQAAELLSQGQRDQAAQVLQSRSAAVRQRAEAIGGEEAEYMFDDADQIDGQLQGIQAAPASPAANRSMELQLEDAAMDAEGY